MHPFKIRNCIAYLIIAAFFAVCAYAEKLPLKHFSSADGLASSVIHSITRDSRGFLWFCARGGLSRFDGFEFSTFQFEAGQSSILVHQLLESRDGTIWIATGAGLYRVKPTVSEQIVPINVSSPKGVRRLNAEKVSNQAFWVLFEDSKGRLWGGLNNLFLIENKEAPEVTVREVPYYPEATKQDRGAIRHLIETSGGEIWAAFDSGLLRILEGERFYIYEVPRTTELVSAFALTEDSGGNIWYTHNTGIYILKPQPFESLEKTPGGTVFKFAVEEQKIWESGKILPPAKPGSIVKLKLASAISEQNAVPVAEDIFRADDGKIWLPTIHGIYVISGEEFQVLRDSTASMSIVKSIAQDLDGNLWFGTFSGVVKYVNGGLITYDQSSGLRDPAIHTLSLAPDGELIASHGIWEISRLMNSGFETFNVPIPANVRFIWTSYPIFTDRTGVVWGLTTKGLYRYANRSADKFDDLDGREFSVDGVFEKGHSFYRGFTDSRGNLWFSTRGTDDNLLILYDSESGKWKELSKVPGYPAGSSVVSIAEDKTGAYWFGFYGRNGIFRYSNDRFTEIGTKDGLPNGSIFALHTDSLGRLWIGSTSDGIARIEDPAAEKPQFTYFRESEGLASNNIRCLAEDLDGKIYAGTVRGVSRINTETGNIRNFTTSDGLAADFVHTALRDGSGAMWFGTSNGLSKLIPVRERALSEPQTFISDLQIAGVNYSVSEFGQSEVSGINVSSSESNLNINFFAVGEARTVRYQYKLEGADEDWSVPGEQRSINYANLAPGSYKFLVRAINEVNKTGEKPAMISFTIHPPFWRTWWFLGLIVLFAGSAVFGLDRYRVAKTRQVESALSASRESELRFRTLADTATDAILTIDDRSNIVFVNQAIEKVFGYAPDELIGRKLTILMPDDKRQPHDSGLNRYLSTGKRNVNWGGIAFPGLHKSGEIIPLEISFGEFERDGNRFFTAIARDVSERKRVELELQKAREERFAELERVRTRIATDLHDDIGSSLTQIAVLSEVARGQARQIQAEDLSSPLERIKTVSKDLVGVMSDIVWAINPQKDFLHDLVQRMRRFGADVYTARGIKFDFHAPAGGDDFKLGANIRREVFAIFKEGVNNSVKYSECDAAFIEFSINDSLLALRIEDNGKGFDTSAVLSEDFRPEIGGNGLTNIRRRVSELGGICEIRSEKGKGTSISVKIPVINF